MPVEVKMARPLRMKVREAGYAAVVIVGERERAAHRLQAAENVAAVLPALQLGNYRPLEIADLIWTPGLVAARTIVTAAERGLVRVRLAPHWYGAELPLIRSTVVEAARLIQCRTWTHEALLEHVRWQEMAEADRFAQDCARRLFVPDQDSVRKIC